MVRWKPILGAMTRRYNSLVSDILDHYENYRANLLTGKAMIVAYSRPIAMKIYKRILELLSRHGRRKSVLL